MKSIRVQGYSGPHFPAFGLNSKRYYVSVHIQSERGKIRIRITPNTDTFYEASRQIRSQCWECYEKLVGTPKEVTEIVKIHRSVLRKIRMDPLYF